MIELLREMYSLLAWHMIPRDACPRAALYRLASKASGSEIDAGEVEVSEAFMTLDEMLAVRQDMHEGRKPKKRYRPAIVLRIDAGDFILDGQNRINVLMRENNHGPHRVLVVSLK